MINQRLLHNIKTLSHNVLDRVLEGSGNRSRVVAVLDDLYNHLYINGHINRPCRVSITSGRAEYATANSTMQFRSGIEVKITDLNHITDDEFLVLTHILLIAFPQLVRKLISLGFDTWRGKLADNPNTLDIRLTDFVNYRPPMNITYDNNKQKNTTPKAISEYSSIQKESKEFNGKLYS